ncbi:MAG: hypothetical protein KatS3mg103_0259 [Phycisphaerales bacterium]|nr:MAG: hypothetical protein KatS3mg103_0259 [Phycisphaerales bacterium]
MRAAYASSAGLSLEMLGYYSDQPGSQRSPLPESMGIPTPPRGDFLALVGVKRHQRFTRALAQAMQAAEPQAPLLVLDAFVVPPPDILRSDHAQLLIRGWPGAMLTDTANFRNPHYHQPTDTVQTLDIARLARAIAQIAGGIDALANPTPTLRQPTGDEPQSPDEPSPPGTPRLDRPDQPTVDPSVSGDRLDR